MDQTCAFIYSEEEMPRYCAAPLCNNSSLNGDPSLHLFKFPLKNEELLGKWMANTRRDQFFPNDNSYLCSEHFEPSDIIHTFGRTTLKPDAIPTVFKFSTMPTCYVPGCRSGYVVNGKVDPERHFFPPPKNHDKLENWNRAIRRTDKRLDNNCRVCDLHFEEYFIEKYFTLLSNGEIKKHEPGKWTLHPDAIPTKLLPPRRTSAEKKAANVPSVEKTEDSQSFPPSGKTVGIECEAPTVSTILLVDSSGKVSSVENIQIPQYISAMGNLPIEGNQCSTPDTIIILDNPADISSLENSNNLQYLPSVGKLPTEGSSCTMGGDTVILLDNSLEVSTAESAKSAQDLPPPENQLLERTDCNPAPDIITIPDSVIEADTPLEASQGSSVNADDPLKTALSSQVKINSPLKASLGSPVEADSSEVEMLDNLSQVKTNSPLKASLGSPVEADSSEVEMLDSLIRANSSVKASLNSPAKEVPAAEATEVSSSEKQKGKKRLPSVEEIQVEESNNQHDSMADFTESSALRGLLESRLAAAKAKDVDTSLMTLEFGNKRIEWVYRGSNKHTPSSGKVGEQDEIQPNKKICRAPSSREGCANTKFSRLLDDPMIYYGSDEEIPKPKIKPRQRTVSVQTDDFFRPQIARKHTSGILLNSEDRNHLPFIPKAKKRFKKPEPLPHQVITPKYYPQLAKKQACGKPARAIGNTITGFDKKLNINTSKESAVLKQPSVVSHIHVARKRTGGQMLTSRNEIIGLAKKSTTLSLLEQMKKKTDNNRVQSEKEDEIKMTPVILMQSNKPIHKCGRACSRIKDDDPVKYRGKNPLQIPRLCGWKRHVEKKIVVYAAPCGRLFRTIDEISRYLWIVKSKLSIDLFCFDSEVYMANEFIPKNVLAYIPDVTFGKENVPVSCVNSINEEYPPDIKYSSVRYPGKGVTLNLDPEYLCGCDCKDNCQNSKRCQCQQLTINATEALPSGKIPNAGYKYRRLLEPLLTGIYECNSRCKCGPSCMNRVAQNGLQVRLQLFYTGKKGWGIRCLDDIPRGMFICTYAGELLTEQGASEEGRQLQDDYLAELDHIEVVEKLKEGYESDVIEPDDEADLEEEHHKADENTVVEDIKLDSDGLSTDIKQESQKMDTLSIKIENGEDKIIQPFSESQHLDTTISDGAISDLQTPTEDLLKQDKPSATDNVESATAESMNNMAEDINNSLSMQEQALNAVMLEGSQNLPVCAYSGTYVSAESVTETRTTSFSLPVSSVSSLQSNSENVSDAISLKFTLTSSENRDEVELGHSLPVHGSDSLLSALTSIENVEAAASEGHSLPVCDSESLPSSSLTSAENPNTTMPKGPSLPIHDLESPRPALTSSENTATSEDLRSPIHESELLSALTSAGNHIAAASQDHSSPVHLLSETQATPLLAVENTSFDASEHLDSHKAPCINVDSDVCIDSKESFPSIQQLDQDLALPTSEGNAGCSVSVQKSDIVRETSSIDISGNSLSVQPSDKAMETNFRDVTEASLNVHMSVTSSNCADITNMSLNIQTPDQGIGTDSQTITDNSLNIQVMESNSLSTSPLNVQMSDNIMDTDSQDILDTSANVQASDQVMETDSSDTPNDLLVQTSEQIMETDSQDVPDNSLNMQPSDQAMETDSREATGNSLITQASDQGMDVDSKEVTGNSLIAQASDQVMETESKEVTGSSLLVQASDQDMETDSQDAVDSSLGIQASDKSFSASDVHLGQANFPLLASVKNSSCDPSLETSIEQSYVTFGRDSVQGTNANPSNIRESSQEQTLLIPVENGTENSNPIVIETPNSSIGTLSTLAESAISCAPQQGLSIGHFNETQNSVIYIQNPPCATGESSGGQTLADDSTYLLTNITSDPQLAMENSLNPDSVMIAIITLPDGSQRICQLSQDISLNNRLPETSLSSAKGESNSSLISSECVTSQTENTHLNLITDPSKIVQVFNETPTTLSHANSDCQAPTEHCLNAQPISPSLIPLSMLVESALQNANEKNSVFDSQRLLQITPTVLTASEISDTTDSGSLKAQSLPLVAMTNSPKTSSNTESSNLELFLAQNYVENKQEDKIDIPLNHIERNTSQDHSVRNFSEAETREIDVSKNSVLHSVQNGEDAANNSSNDQLLSSVQSQFTSNSTNNPKRRKKPKEDLNFPSVRTFFNEEYCYLMNAEKCGNIGRYLNHSCNPNCFVQSVFVDSHDLRFPWVAFFALRHISAGSELTWDYNYSVGSVPGKILYCHCASRKCRGRLI